MAKREREKHYHYFKFNPSKYLSGIISELDDDAQGIFINICCQYWIRKCDMTFSYLKAKYSKRWQAIAKNVDAQTIRIDEAKDRVNIPFLDEQWNEKKDLGTARASAGYEGSKKRWGSKPKQPIANANILHSNISTNTNNNLKVIRERKKAPTLEEFVAYFVEHGFPKSLAERAYKGYDANKDKDGRWRDSRDKLILNWKTKCQQVWFREDNRAKPSETDKIVDSGKVYEKGL